MPNMKRFQALLEAAKRDVELQDTERLSQIAQLFKTLQHQYFDGEDPQSYGQLLQLAFDFAVTLKQEQKSTFLAILFEIEPDDIELAVYALSQPNYGRWLLSQWHDLDDHCRKEQVRGENIQPFLKAVIDDMLSGQPYLPSVDEQFHQLKAALEADDAVMLNRTAKVIKSQIKAAYIKQEVDIMANIIFQTEKMMTMLAREGQYQLISQLLELDSNESTRFRLLIESSNQPLTLWYLIKTFELEKYAREMPIDGDGHQAFIKAVMLKLGSDNPFRTIDKLVGDFNVANETNDKKALDFLEIETDLIFEHACLAHDLESASNMVELLFQLSRQAIAEKQFVTLQNMLMMSPHQLSDFMLLTKAGDEKFAKILLVNNQRMIDRANNFAVDFDLKDSQRVASFNKDLYTALQPSGVVQFQDEIFSSLRQIAESPSHLNKQRLKLKLKMLFENAYLENNFQQFMDIAQFFMTTSKTLFYPEKTDLLIDVMELTPRYSELLMMSCQHDDINHAVYLLARSQLSNAQIDWPMPLTYQSDFSTQLEEKIKDVDLVRYYIEPDIDDELLYSSDGCIDAWRDILCSSRNVSVEKLLQIKKQLSEKVKIALKDGDATQYAELSKLVFDYLKHCAAKDDLGTVSLLLNLEGEKVDYLKRLLAENKESQIKWFIAHALAPEQDVDPSCGPCIKESLTILNTSLAFSVEGMHSDITSLLLAIGNDNKANIAFYARQIRHALTESLFLDDGADLSNTAVIISQMRSLIAAAIEHPNLFILIASLGFDLAESDEIIRLIDDGEKEMALLAMCHSKANFNQLKLLKAETEQPAVIKELYNQLGFNQIRMQRKIDKIEQALSTALESDDAAGMEKGLNQLDQMIQIVFLSGLPDEMSMIINAVSEITKQAYQQSRSDLIIEHYQLNNDELEIFDLLRESTLDGHDINNLFKFWVLQKMELEHVAEHAGLSNDYCQAFKKSVHHQLDSSSPFLVGSLELLQKACQQTLKYEKPTMTQLNQLKFLFGCQLQYHYEQKNTVEFASVIIELNSTIRQAFAGGKVMELLKSLDIKLETRNAIIHYLELGNQQCCQQQLLDAMLEQCQLTLEQKGATNQATEFRMDVYRQLKLTPPEIDNLYFAMPSVMPSDQKGYHAHLLQRLSSEVLPLDMTNEDNQKLLSRIAASEVYQLADGYLSAKASLEAKQTRDLLTEYRFMHLFNHRNNLPGFRTVADTSFFVEGGQINDMVRELQDSISSQDVCSPMDTTVKQTIMALRAPRALSDVIERYQAHEIVNLPISTHEEPTAESPFSYHASNVCFYDRYCLIADRSRGEDGQQGIAIYEIGDNSELEAVFDELCQTGYQPHQLKSDALRDVLVERLKLAPIGQMMMPEQLSGNCTWASCAEMTHLSTAFIAALMQNEMNIEQSAMQALDYHHQFIIEDSKRLIEKYLQARADSSLPIDKLSLTLAYLKYQHHPQLKPIADFINSHIEITPSDIDEGMAFFIEQTKKLILAEKREIDSEADAESAIATEPSAVSNIDKISKQLVHHYLNHQYDEISKLMTEITGKKETKPLALSAGFLFFKGDDSTAADTAAPSESPQNRIL